MCLINTRKFIFFTWLFGSTQFPNIEERKQTDRSTSEKHYFLYYSIESNTTYCYLTCKSVSRLLCNTNYLSHIITFFD